MKKKYFIVFISAILLFTLFNRIEVADRIRYQVLKMASFNSDKYYVKDKKVDNTVKLRLDMKTYAGGSAVIYSTEDNKKLVLEDIVYNGDSYQLIIDSKGYSSFNEGNILVLDFVSDQTIESDSGNLHFQLVGVDSGKKNSKVYRFDIYPENESVELINLQCEVELKNIMSREYIRK